ncbi:adenosine deaminase [soil metagenome]
MSYPKIELHVHFEGTVQASTVLEIARRNDVALPVRNAHELADLYRYRDFAHFVTVWVLTTQVLRRADDFRRIVVEYAREASAYGALYVEGIFSPAEPVRRGSSWEEVFEGYCDGAQEARELHGVEVQLTPDITRSYGLDEAELVVRYTAAYRDRGVVGVGLGGPEVEHPPTPFEHVFRLARENGLASVPHAGELAGVDSIRDSLERLGAHRIRHGIRAVDDTGLVRELADRRTVLDVCPISNLRIGAVRSLEEHPLPHLMAAGVLCSLSTDDPALFGTNLHDEYEAARSLGLRARDFYEAGVEGALCDGPTRERLRSRGKAFDWDAVDLSSGEPRTPA